MSHDTCIFCQIAEGKIPSKRVKETDTLLAFEDVHPGAPTHILVIPKEHVASVNDLETRHTAVLGEMVLLAKAIAKEKNIDQTGFRLVMNTGPQAGQSVFHIHLHVLGGRFLAWPPG